MELGTVAGKSSSSSDEGADFSGNERAVCTRPIDLVHLARYTMGNKTLEKEILDLFVDQSRLTLERLTAASNDKEWRDQAHALLGSARAVGANCVADKVLIAQKLPAGRSDRNRESVLAAVAAEIDAANRYIRDLFSEE